MELGALYQTIGRGIALVRAAGASFTSTTRGVASITRTSAGLYVITLNTATPGAAARSILTFKGLVAASGTVTDTSDTVKTISTFTTGATAADVDFDFSIEALDA